MSVTLNSVREGGLEISLNLPDNQNDLFKVEAYSQQWPFNGLWPPYDEKLHGRMTTAITGIPLREVANDLQRSLANSAKFVVPGGGTFFYKDPIFNKHGDVLIEAEYDG